MEIFIIRSENPLDHEGSADVVEVFTDKTLAEEALALLSAAEEEECRRKWKDRWRAFAVDYSIEEWSIATSPEAVLKTHYPVASS